MKSKSQRGGFVMGLVVGLLVGLALALGVALYITKVPVPFVNKVPQRSADQDAAEAEKNKNWDPNAPLGGKAAQRAASGMVQPPPPTQPLPAPTPAPAPAPQSQSTRDPAAILSGQPASGGAAATATAPAKSTRSGGDAFSYFVQAGAFARPEDAEQQRARLAMQGMAARVTEREQSGRTVYRVRLGPYEQKDDAETAQQRLQGAGVEAALVRVER